MAAAPELKAIDVINRVKITRLNDTYKLHARLFGMRGLSPAPSAGAHPRQTEHAVD